MAGTLFVVATPIGNLEDMTLRAIRVLREASVVAAEDTRHTAKLLNHFEIRTPTLSVYEQNERDRIPELLAKLSAGQHVALVSDAGTPAVSDPGFRLVRAAIEAGIRVESVPGASAILAALVSSGLPTDRFTFVGFPPPKALARDRWLADLAGRSETLVLFEAPHRVRETLDAVLRVLGNREVAVGRELTKMHEELLRGPVAGVLDRLGTPRGEFTVIVGAARAETAPLPAGLPDDDRVFGEFGQLTENGLDRRAALHELAGRYGVASRQVYAAVERAKAKTVQ